MPSDADATYRVLRELGSRAQRTFAAIRDPNELVVLHRFARSDRMPSDATPVSSEKLASLHRDAQSIAKHWHQNVTRVKHVDLTDGNLVIATELIDGSTLADLFAAASARGVSFPLEVLVRILLDVLAGVHGLHLLRDAGNQQRLGVIHGELSPANIVVGRDGIARVINVLRPRPVKILEGSEAVRHAAPELLDGDATDGRADVYAVGVILWEALSQKKLHDETKPARLLARLREMQIARPAAPGDASHAPLVEIAMRAISFDPALRFRTAAEMATEIRKVKRIALGSVVAARVNELEGERIVGRRASLERTEELAVPDKSDTVPAPPMPEVIDPSAVDDILVELLPSEPQLKAAPSASSAKTQQHPGPAPKSPMGVPRVSSKPVLSTPLLASVAAPPPPPPPSSNPVLPLTPAASPSAVAAPPSPPPPSPSWANPILEAPPPFTEMAVPPETLTRMSGLNASVDVDLDGASDVGTPRKRRRLGLVLAASAALLLLGGAFVIGLRAHPSDDTTIARSPMVDAPARKHASPLAVSQLPSATTDLGATAAAPARSAAAAVAEPPWSSSASERTIRSAGTAPPANPERTAAAPPVALPTSTPSASSSSAPRPPTRRYEPLGI